MPNNDYLDFLAHHGILGQKWGVRRYQNPDGSLTSAGEKRYRKTIKAMDRFDAATTRLGQLREKFNATNVSKEEKQKVFNAMKVEAKAQNKAARKMFKGASRRVTDILRDIKSDKELMAKYKNAKALVKINMKGFSVRDASKIKDTMECYTGFQMANNIIRNSIAAKEKKDVAYLFNDKGALNTTSNVVRSKNKYLN